MKKNRKCNKIQTTKKFMSIILIVSLIDLQLPFILAFLGKDSIAETLGITIATEIIGVFAVYCLKSFFETKEEKKTEKDYFKMVDSNNGCGDG